MVVETLNLKHNKTMRVVRLSRVAGREAMIAAGFKAAINPNYMSNNQDFAHYNGSMKCWILESITA